MKTVDQIVRYVSDCQFSDKDWGQVLSYCRTYCKGNRLCRCKNPKADSTYQQFIDWIHEGFGAGDYVSYGKTMGIVGKSLPIEGKEKVTLAAYCDYEGKLIIQDLEVVKLDRLHHLDKDRKEHLKQLIFDQRLYFNARYSMFDKLYIPKKYFHVVIDDPTKTTPDVGMYLESDNSNHHFLAYLSGDRLQMDCWIDSKYAPLKPARDEDTKRLYAATSKAGLSYNERSHQFIKVSKKNKNNVYWYLNDRFELVMDRDDGGVIHQKRWDAGNYILSQTEGILFMGEVKKLRGKA